jgi:hypothetical protein
MRTTVPIPIYTEEFLSRVPLAGADGLDPAAQLGDA